MAIATDQCKPPGPADAESANLSTLRGRPAWGLLEQHYQNVKPVHLRQLFADDRGRGERFVIEAAGVYLDYSKNRITKETLQLLLQLAHESSLRDRIDPMFRGDKINVSKNRARRHLERPDRQTHPQRDQYRYRRIGPWAGNGVRGAQAL